MKHLLAMLALVASSVLSAQPVFTSANMQPTIGPFSGVLYTTQYVDAGPATADFDYNVGPLTLGPPNFGPAQYLATAGSTPYASDFPGATYAFTDNSNFYMFYSVTDTAYKSWGWAFPGEMDFLDFDGQIQMPFPCSMGTTWTDSINGSGSVWGGYETRAGIVTGHYNGHGTLTLPFATFNNVARIETVEDYMVYHPVHVYHNVIHSVSYQIPGHTLFQTVKGTTVQDTNEPNITYLSLVIDPIAAGISTNDEAKHSMRIFPNPANDAFTLAFNMPLNGTATVTLLDALGRTVSSLQPTSVEANSTAMSFDVSSVPRGMYIVRVVDAQGRSSKMPLVLH